MRMTRNKHYKGRHVSDRSSGINGEVLIIDIDPHFYHKRSRKHCHNKRKFRYVLHADGIPKSSSGSDDGKLIVLDCPSSDVINQLVCHADRLYERNIQSRVDSSLVNQLNIQKRKHNRKRKVASQKTKQESASKCFPNIVQTELTGLFDSEQNQNKIKDAIFDMPNAAPISYPNQMHPMPPSEHGSMVQHQSILNNAQLIQNPLNQVMSESSQHNIPSMPISNVQPMSSMPIGNVQTVPSMPIASAQQPMHSIGMDGNQHVHILPMDSTQPVHPMSRSSIQLIPSLTIEQPVHSMSIASAQPIPSILINSSQHVPVMPRSSVQSIPPMPRSSVQSIPPMPRSSVQSIPQMPRSSVQSIPQMPRSSVQSIPLMPRISEETVTQMSKPSVPIHPMAIGGQWHIQSTSVDDELPKSSIPVDRPISSMPFGLIPQIGFSSGPNMNQILEEQLRTTMTNPVIQRMSTDSRTPFTTDFGTHPSSMRFDGVSNTNNTNIQPGFTSLAEYDMLHRSFADVPSRGISTQQPWLISQMNEMNNSAQSTQLRSNQNGIPEYRETRINSDIPRQPTENTASNAFSPTMINPPQHVSFLDRLRNKMIRRKVFEDRPKKKFPLPWRRRKSH